MTVSTVSADSAGLFGWWREAPPAARRSLVAGSLGWMLDSFDVMLYALVLASLMLDLGMTKTTAGLLGSVTLLASAAGGMVFGVFADRYGRTRALMASILIYSVFTGACGFAQTVGQLAVFRILLGLGMGGEWASGAALVSETWPAASRGKALGVMQSSWAIGYGTAAIVTALILPVWGWRAVFFVGILPAFFTAWVRRRVEEPEIWRTRQTARTVSPLGGFGEMFRGDLLPVTVAVTLMNACTMFAWWGFNLWIPAYLSLPVASGGVGLTTYRLSVPFMQDLQLPLMTVFIVTLNVGMWFGYVTFGFIADAVGRKRTYVIYLVTAAALILAYSTTHNRLALLVLGPFVGFFGTGYFSGFGAVSAEIYRTEIRATAQGFTYNIGRVASAAAPFLVGSIAETHGFGVALSMCAFAFALAALSWFFIPETIGKVLE